MGLPADSGAVPYERPSLGVPKEGQCCGAEPAGSAETSARPRRARGTTTAAEPTRGHSAPRFDARGVDFAFSSSPRRVSLNVCV